MRFPSWINRPWAEGAVVAALLLIILCATFGDVIFSGRTFKVSTAVAMTMPYGVYGQQDNQPPHLHTFGVDSAVLEEPIYEFVKQELWQGRFPLWNPHQGAGYPLIAMAHFGFFFPLHAILYLLPQVIAWDVLILCRFFLAGFLMFLFLRYIRLGRLPSLTGAVAFMLSGPLVLIQNQTANVDILLPLYLLSLEALARHPGKKRFFTHAGCVALVVFGGNPEHIFLVMLMGGLYLLHRLVVLRRKIPVQKVLTLYALSCGLGFGLSAITLFPFISNFLTQFWTGHPERVGLVVEELRARAISIILPHFFQPGAMTRTFVPMGWLGGYLGIVPLGLAVLGLSLKQRQGLNWFFAALGILLVLKAYGVGLVQWLAYVPLLGSCRFAYHGPPFVAFSCAVLVALGMRVFLNRKRVLRVGLVYGLFIAGLVGVSWLRAHGQPFWPWAQRAAGYGLILIVLWGVICWGQSFRSSRTLWACGLFLLMTLELFSYVDRDRPRRYHTFPSVPYMDFLRDREEGRVYGMFWTLFPNVATAYRVDDVGIFDGLLLQRFVGFINALVLPGHFKKDLSPTTLRTVPILGTKDFLDLLNLKYLVSDPGRPILPYHINSDRLRQVYDGEVRIFERQDVMPRAFVVHRAVFHHQSEPDYGLLHHLRDRLGRVVVLTGHPDYDVIAQLQAVPEQDASSARIVRSLPNRVDLQVQMDHAGFLVLADTFHPGWQALADGRPTKVYEADFLLRAVFLPAGKHHVRFVFRPPSFLLGVTVSLLSVILCLWLLRGKGILWPCVSRRKG